MADEVGRHEYQRTSGPRHPGSLLVRESRIEIRGREAPPEQPVGTTDWLMTKLMFIDPPAPPLPPAIPTVALFARVQFGA